MDDKLQKAQELEKQAQQLRYEAREEKRRAELKAKEEFVTTKKMNVYTSDDYCGLTADKYSFYYGYEETVCSVKSHRKNCEDYGCEKREWAFTADVDGKEVLRLPTSQLHPTQGEEPFWYLVAGIGHFLLLTPNK